MTPASFAGRDRINDLLTPRSGVATATDDAVSVLSGDGSASPADAGMARSRGSFAELMSMVERADAPASAAQTSAPPPVAAVAPVAATLTDAQIAQIAEQVVSSRLPDAGPDPRNTIDFDVGVVSRDKPFDLPGFLRRLPQGVAERGTGGMAGTVPVEIPSRGPSPEKPTRLAKETEATDPRSTDVELRLPSFLVPALAPLDRGTRAPAARASSDAPVSAPASVPLSASTTVPVSASAAAPAAGPTIPPVGEHARQLKARPGHPMRGEPLPAAVAPIATETGPKPAPPVVGSHTDVGDDRKPGSAQPARAGQAARVGPTNLVPSPSSIPQAGTGAQALHTAPVPVEMRIGNPAPARVDLGKRPDDTRRTPRSREETAVTRHLSSRRETQDLLRRMGAESVGQGFMMTKPAAAERSDTSIQASATQASTTAAASSPSSILPDLSTVQVSTGPSPDPMSATTTPSLRQPVGTEAWQDELSAQLSFMAEQGDRSEAVMKLAPEELGELEIRVELRDGDAALQFGAVNAEARQALELAQPRLKEMFSSQGLTVTEFKVFSNLSGNPHSDSRHGGQPSNGRSATRDDGTDTGVTVRARRALGVVDTYA